MGNIRPQKRVQPVGRLIVAFSGLPGSGKTTLAGALAKRLNATLFSFGNYVRSLAAAEGVEVDRAALQNIGEREVAAGAGAFVAAAMSTISPGWSTLIIDGIRHQSVLNELRNLAATHGISFTLVHVTATERDRLGRLRARGESTAVSRLAMHHRVEQGAIKVLPKEADFVINTSTSTDETLTGLIASLLA